MRGKEGSIRFCVDFFFFFLGSVYVYFQRKTYGLHC